MTHIPTPDSSDKEALIDILEREISAVERSTRRTAWIGGALVLLIGGYLIYLVGQVNAVVFNPDNLSEVATQLVDERVPGVIADTEQSLREDAGPMAVRLVDTIRATLPELRVEAEHRILVLKEATPVMQDIILQAIHEVTSKHRDELRKTAELHSNKEFLDAFLTNLADELVTELEAYLAKEFNEPSLSQSFQKVAVTLQEINGFIRTLHSERMIDLSRREQLYRRTLAAWFVLLAGHPGQSV